MASADSRAKRPTRRTVLKAAGGAAVGALAGAGVFHILKRRPPNIVFLISDALRADMLGAAGPAGKSLTPFLDAMAARGTLYQNCIAPSSWTLPSVAGIMSSRNPLVAGAFYNESYAAGATTFAHELQKAGYLTLAVVKNPWLPARDRNGELLPTIVTKGFEHYDVGGVSLDDNPLHEKGIGQPREFMAFAPPEEASDQAAALKEARARGGRPFCLYLHYMNTHQPYSPSPRHAAAADAAAEPVEGIPDHLIHHVLSHRAAERGFTAPLPAGDGGLVARIKALYDAATVSVDAAAARLAEHLDRSGQLENTIMIFTSDHGEEFGERGRCGHSVTLYQECIHVPLVIRGPSIPAGVRVARPVRGVDIAPAILRLAGREAPADFEGDGLGLSGEQERSGDALSCTVSPALPRKLETVTMSLLETGGKKLILRRPAGEAEGDEAREFFDLNSDPAERTNLAAGSPAVAALREKLQRHVAIAARRPMAARMKLDEKTEELLRSLGYFN